jgi:hypothetical protein
MEFSNKNLGYMLMAAVVVGGLIIAQNAGFFGNAQAFALTPSGQPAQGQQVIVTYSTGGCPTTGTSDISALVQESVADSTGVNRDVPGTMGLYYDGTSSPFTNITLSGTGYASSTIDPACNSQLFGVFSNASYYGAKTATVTAGNAPSTRIDTVKADLIATMAVTGRNESGVSNQASGMNTNISVGQIATYDVLSLTAATARGVIRTPAVCFTYNTTNYTQVRVQGGASIEVPTGIASGYQECWTLGVDRVSDYATVNAQLIITPIAGVDPNATISARFIDLGTYLKATNGVLYDGYQNADTKADTGATNVNFVINVD